MDGRLELTGEPYYHFWTSNPDENKLRLAAIDERLDAIERSRTILLEKAKTLDVEAKVEKQRELLELYNSYAGQSVSPETAKGLDRVSNEIEELGMAIDDYNVIVGQANRLTEEADALIVESESLEPKASMVPGPTKGLRENRWSLRSFNPTVYDAAVQTMRFAALFRHVKQHNANNWNAFISQVRYLSTQPSVTTPTRLPKSTALERTR